MDIHSLQFKIVAIFLSTVLAFVVFAQPISAKADSDSLDYVETSLSTQEVCQLVAGVDDLALGVILGILGFIILTYMTLRNVHLPIENLDQMTFIDKKDIILVERLDGETIITTKDGEFHTSVSLGSIEEKLEPKEFMRCHKSYIINLSMITRIEVYGRWTYTVKLKGTNATALMTSQNYEEIKKRYE